MNKTCECGASTRRQDGICQNCAAITVRSFNFPVVAHLITRKGGQCETCGFKEEPALRLFRKMGADAWKACPKSLLDQMDWAERAAVSPDQFYVICLNCHHARLAGNSGRPRKHATEIERRVAAQEYQQTYKAGVRLRVYSLFPKCVCGDLATCIHWVGEHGEGPKGGGQYKKWSRILNDAEYARNFSGFCEAHKPAPYFTRASRGEVPKPLGWKQA